MLSIIEIRWPFLPKLGLLLSKWIVASDVFRSVENRLVCSEVGLLSDRPGNYQAACSSRRHAFPQHLMLKGQHSDVLCEFGRRHSWPINGDHPPRSWQLRDLWIHLLIDPHSSVVVLTSRPRSLVRYEQCHSSWPKPILPVDRRHRQPFQLGG